MAQLQEFTFGWFTPVMAYAVSVVGSLLGLLCTIRAQELRPMRRHVRWLLLASLSIGGMGIWLMHFTAMLGFGVQGSVVRFDLPLTLLSAIVAVAVVGCGIFIVGYGEPSRAKLALGGVFTGLGVATMHYTGMAAMHVAGMMEYDVALVVLSIVIALVAATAALWFTVSLRSAWAVTAGALIMGVAVCGMHYTGMAAMSIRLMPGQQDVQGIDPMSFVIPVLVAGFAVVALLLISVLTAPSAEDLELHAKIMESPRNGEIQTLATESMRGPADPAPGHRPVRP